MQCAACRREAVVFQPYSGKHLCPVHFARDFEAKAKRAIRKNRWLLPGDHTAVVLTGDAAEAALLAFLHKLTKDRRDVDLSAIAIDEGTAGDAGRTVAELCGVELFFGSFAERYGTTRDALIRAEGAGAADRICGVLAGDLAAEIAAARGITRLALATTVDDRALRFFSDLVDGTVEGTLFCPETLGTARVPVIRPFMDIPRTEVYRYAELCGIAPGEGVGRADENADAAAALAAYDARHPATKFALANLAGTLAGIAGTSRAPHDRCPACGSPREAGRCFACEIREKYTREPKP
jgi:tRNA(Ile)-lysidine synthase TilS/MesJ